MTLHRDRSTTQSRYYEFSTLDTSPSLFRYWQVIPREVLEIVAKRTPAGFYLSEGFTSESFAPLFDIMEDSEEGMVEVHEDADPSAIDDMLEKVVGARASQKTFSHAVMIWAKFSDSTENTLYWIEDDQIEIMDVRSGTKEITKFKFIPDSSQDKVTAKPVDVTNLKNVFLLAEYNSTMDKFRSYFEPIIDDLINLSSISQQSALLMIRVGSGIRWIKAPQSMLTSDKKRQEFRDFLENMGMNSLLIVPDGTDSSGEFEFGLKFGEGSTPDYMIHRNMALEAISIKTGFPRELLIGSELGLRSAETNRQSFLNLVSKEQKSMSHIILWCLSKILDCDKCVDGTHTLRWKALVAPDEAEVIEILGKKIDILLKANPNIIKAIDHKELMTLLDLELKIDEGKLKQLEAEAQTLKEGLLKGQTDSDERQLEEEPNQSPQSNSEEEEEIE